MCHLFDNDDYYMQRLCVYFAKTVKKLCISQSIL